MTLFVLIVISVVWGLAFAKWPERMFNLLPLILPTYVIRTSIGPLPTTMLELLIIASVAGWVGQGAGRGARGAGIAKTLRDAWTATKGWRMPIGLWLLAGFISIFVSPNHIAALGLYRAYFIEPILLFVIGLELMKTEARNEKREAKHFLSSLFPHLSSLASRIFRRYPSRLSPLASRLSLPSSLALVAIVLGVWSIVQILTGWGIPEPWNFSPERRAVGPFPFPNALALFVTPIAAFLFADLVRGWRKKKEECSWLVSPWLSIPGYLLSLIAIILAESDGGLIALGAASFLVLVLNKRTRVFGITIAILGTIFIASIAPLRERAITVLMFREWSSKVRIVMWQETLLMLKDHKIMGAGLGGYPMVIRVYHRSGDWMEIFQYPHNIFLNIWSETGLLGLVAFGWILGRWARGKTEARLERRDSRSEIGDQRLEGREVIALNATRAKIGDLISRFSHLASRIFRLYPSRLSPLASRISLPIIAALLVHGLVDVPYFKNDLAVLFWLLILVTISYDKKRTH